MAGEPSDHQEPMHFHIRGLCTNCLYVELYRTALPSVLIAGDLCHRCLAPDMLGLDDDTDDACKRCVPDRTRRYWHRYLNGDGVPGWP